MEKTLYLSENQGLRVRCDGPSLWIERGSRAGQRVPARLVRRVVVVGNVTLDTGSLTLLARRGVPIALLDRRGEPLAMVLGLEDGSLQRRVRQAALSEDREKRERIAAWLDAWERGRQLSLVRRLDPARARLWRQTGFRQRDYEEWIVAQARARAQDSGARAVLRGALQELVASEILAGGWDPHAGVRHNGTVLGFVKDCVSVLHPDVDSIWVMLPLREQGEPRSERMRKVVSRFESARGRLESLVRLMLDQYGRLLLEI